MTDEKKTEKKGIFSKIFATKNTCCCNVQIIEEKEEDRKEKDNKEK